MPTREGAILMAKRAGQGLTRTCPRSIYSKRFSRGQHCYGADADLVVIDEVHTGRIWRIRLNHYSLPVLTGCINSRAVAMGVQYPCHFGHPCPWVLYLALERTRMWANAQRDGRPAEYRWRPLFNAANFG